MTRRVLLAAAIIPQLLFCIAGFASAGDESAANCRPIPGLDSLLEPGLVLLLGELHGTAQSPAFLLDLACHAARTGLPLVVGLELDPAEQVTVDRYLESAGAPADRTALIAGEIWQRDYQDGRNSSAMAEIIEGVRVLRREGFAVEVSLFDAAYDRQRETRMAENLVATARENPEGLTLVLTGNLHSRVTAGAGSPPMGYLIATSIGVERVVSFDLAHRGGSSWLCFATENGQECGDVGLKGRGPVEPAGITLLDAISATGHHGWYQVGEITASPPAKGEFSAGSTP